MAEQSRDPDGVRGRPRNNDHKTAKGILARIGRSLSRLRSSGQLYPSLDEVDTPPMPVAADGAVVPLVDEAIKILDETVDIYDPVKNALGKVSEVADFIPNGAFKLAFEHLTGLTKGVPMIAPAMAMLKYILDAKSTADDNDVRLNALWIRVGFLAQMLGKTLDVVQNPNDTDFQLVKDKIDICILPCYEIFTLSKTKSVPWKLYNAPKMRDKCTDANNQLSDAERFLNTLISVTLLRTQAVNSIQFGEMQKRLDEIAAKERAAHDAIQGCFSLSEKELSVETQISQAGRGAVLSAPDLLTRIQEFRDTQVGQKKLVEDLKSDFDTACTEIRDNTKKVLAELLKQDKSFDQMANTLRDINERGSVFRRITCADVRHMWLAASWSTQVDVQTFIDEVLRVLREQIEEKVNALAISSVNSQSSDHASKMVTILHSAPFASELQSRIEHFVSVLRSCDKDQSGLFSIDEVNGFFSDGTKTIGDYFRDVAVLQLNCDKQRLQRLGDLLKNLLPDIDYLVKQEYSYADFLVAVKPSLRSLQQKAVAQCDALASIEKAQMVTLLWPETTSEADGRHPTLPHLVALDTIHETIERIAKMLSNIKSSLDTDVPREDGAQGRGRTFTWLTAYDVFVELVGNLHEWAVEAAATIKDQLKTAAILYGSDRLLSTTDIHRDDQFDATHSRPLPRVACQRVKNAMVPSRAVVGGEIGGQKVYLMQCKVSDQDSSPRLVCGYGVLAGDELLVLSSQGEEVPHKDCSWLVHGVLDDNAKSSVSDPAHNVAQWEAVDLDKVPSYFAAMLCHQFQDSQRWIARVHMPCSKFSLQDEAFAMDIDHTELDDDAPMDVDQMNDQQTAPSKDYAWIPGSLFVHHGALHFECAVRDPLQAVTVFSTLDMAKTSDPLAAGASYEKLERTQLTIQLLVSVQRGTLYQEEGELLWFDPTASEPEGYRRMVVCGTLQAPGHLAWCLGEQGVHLGMWFPDVNGRHAFYAKARPSGSTQLLKSSTFSVLYPRTHDVMSSIHIPSKSLDWMTGMSTRNKQSSETGHLPLKFRTNGLGSFALRRQQVVDNSLWVPDLDCGPLPITMQQLWSVDSHNHHTNLSMSLANSETDRPGFLHILPKGESHGSSSRITAADHFSEDGDLDALNAWQPSSQRLGYTSAAVDRASACGHVDVLEWWKRNFRSELKYTSAAIDDASANGMTEVLDWWRTSGLELRYSERALLGVNKLEVLKWWRQSDIDIKQYAAGVLDTATYRGKVDVLQAWKVSGLLSKYLPTSDVMDSAQDKQTLQWWHNESGITLRPTVKALQMAAKRMDKDALEWLAEQYEDLIPGRDDATVIFDSVTTLSWALAAELEGALRDRALVERLLPGMEETLEVDVKVAAKVDNSETQTVNAETLAENNQTEMAKLVDDAYAYGLSDRLAKLHARSWPCEPTFGRIKAAVSNGHITVIKWALNKFPGHVAWNGCMDAASTAGRSTVASRIAILDALFDVQRTLGVNGQLWYTKKAMDTATELPILQWWFDRYPQDELKYSRDGSQLRPKLQDCPSGRGTAAEDSVLGWWRASPLELRFEGRARPGFSLEARAKARLGNSMWLRQRAAPHPGGGVVPLQSSAFAKPSQAASTGYVGDIGLAVRQGRVDVLQRYYVRNPQATAWNNCMDAASTVGMAPLEQRIAALNWLKPRMTTAWYSNEAMDAATETEILDWWVINVPMEQLKYSRDGSRLPPVGFTTNTERKIFSWWRGSNLPFEFPGRARNGFSATARAKSAGAAAMSQRATKSVGDSVPLPVPTWMKQHITSEASISRDPAAPAPAPQSLKEKITIAVRDGDVTKLEEVFARDSLSPAWKNCMDAASSADGRATAEQRIKVLRWLRDHRQANQPWYSIDGSGLPETGTRDPVAQAVRDWWRASTEFAFVFPGRTRWGFSDASRRAFRDQNPQLRG
ncbi:hypothetical protein RI367_006913 [Sorochytrium milnesiophthora]